MFNILKPMAQAPKVDRKKKLDLKILFKLIR